MKIENQNSTCTCDSYKNMTIKYGSMLDEYFKANQVLRDEVLKLQKEIEHLKDYIKYTL
jgi:LytS/YehU family sensor histidine kinase